MDFPFGTTVHRDRRKMIPDPRNPQKTVPGDFDPDLTIELAGAWVASSSSTALRTATRTEYFEAKSLFLTDVNAEVEPEDRIRVGGTKEDLGSGTAYKVEAPGSADVNPFTGWQPVKEIPLERVRG